MSERPEMITVSYVPGGTAEVHVSLPGSASNSARSSGPSAADVIFASSKLGPADPFFFYAGGLSSKAWWYKRYKHNRKPPFHRLLAARGVSNMQRSSSGWFYNLIKVRTGLT